MRLTYSIIVLVLLPGLACGQDHYGGTDHGWRPWRSWGRCSQTCGWGFHVRTRDCIGGDCPGVHSQSKGCKIRECIRDNTGYGGWSPWRNWGHCSASCGTGTESRYRTCNGQCSGPKSEERRCTLKNCPVTGYGGWSRWSRCSRTCGNSQKTRSRTCNGECFSPQTERQLCYLQNCPVTDYRGWGLWQPWSACSKTCGTGAAFRRRTCFNTVCGGGSAEDYKNCQIRPCNQGYGLWTVWSRWGACSRTCGGMRIRTRRCNGLFGYECPGRAREHKPCSLSCSIYGLWHPWLPWGPCSRTCGQGLQQRIRRCSRERCVGHRTENRMCQRECIVDHWAGWGNWQQCDKTCGGGHQQRVRQCQYQRSQACYGARVEKRACNSNSCIITADWTEWGDCSKQCGGGQQVRTRACSYSQYCYGSSKTSENRPCNTRPCQISETWGDWSDWGSCNATCGGGWSWRSRTCTSQQCIEGHPREGKRCNQQSCSNKTDGTIWTRWSESSECSLSCGGGTRTRNRTCDGAGCPVNPVQQERISCHIQPCPTSNTTWLAWSAWGECTATCGGGTHTRARSCTGAECSTSRESSQTTACNTTPCPKPATQSPTPAPTHAPDTQPPATEPPIVKPTIMWSSWLEWQECDKMCGGGNRIRIRVCTGDSCPNQGHPDRRQSETCNIEPCPAVWAAWEDWSVCSQTCGGGTSTRIRGCAGDGCPEGPHPDRQQTENCNTEECGPTWSSWTLWSSCNPSCGVGTKSRNKNCAGAACTSRQQMQTIRCDNDPCIVEPRTFWSEWSPSACSVSCGGGVRTLRRDCQEACDVQFQEKTATCNPQICPFWTEWREFSACSETCGPGTISRQRNCQGNGCPDVTEETQTVPCEIQPCITCGEWSDFSECTVICGGGTEERARICNGQQEREARICNIQICEGWGEWTRWSACSVTCGGGSWFRNRQCTPEGCQTPPQREEQPCSTEICPGWGSWSTWNTCTVTCGGGTRTRQRGCIPGGCQEEPQVDTGACNTRQCPTPVWTAWEEWSVCTASCNGGTTTRIRGCAGDVCPDLPHPDRQEIRICSTEPCGGWTDWSTWTSCTQTCGGGSRARGRQCVPQGCQEESQSQEEPCGTIDCPPPVWGLWSTWTACSESCEGGVRERHRQCLSDCNEENNQSERHRCNTFRCVDATWATWRTLTPCDVTCGNGTRVRGRSCTGVDCSSPEERQNIPCAASRSTCPPAWGEWEMDQPCSVTCGSGYETRKRTCTSTTVKCEGSSTRTVVCKIDDCPAEWSEWSDWDGCSVTCGVGFRHRTRSCQREDGGCEGATLDQTNCTNEPCPIGWSEWTEYTQCSVTCGRGMQERTRNCQGGDCPGTGTESRPCQTDACPDQGIWGPWLEPGACSVTCGDGVAAVRRNCRGPGECVGSNQKTETCERPECDPTDPEVGAECGVSNTPFSIIGGRETKEGQWPWQANIVINNGAQRCGGAIISNRNILTAAHCFAIGQQRVRVSDVSVLLGSVALEGGTVYGVMEINVHPSFNFSWGMQYDLAVLRVSNDIEFSSTVRPICLPKNPPKNGSACTVTGWGRTSPTSDPSPELKMTNQMILSDKRCQRAWNASGQGFLYDADTMFCGGPNPRNNVPYQGDSGGPMSCPGSQRNNFVVQGIVSAGGPQQRQPTVYTDVSVFLEWIEDAMVYP